MSSIKYDAHVGVAWTVSVKCDGLDREYRVIMRCAQHVSDDRIEPIYLFQFYSGNEIAGSFSFPTQGDQQTYRESALRSLYLVLQCSEAFVVSPTPVEALFGLLG